MKARIGDLIPLELQLSDGNTSMFPRAFLYDAAGALITTKDLTHVANGRYVNDTFTYPANTGSSGQYVEVTYVVYSDSGHTTVAGYAQVSDVYQRDHEFLSIVSSATTTTISCDRAEAVPDYFKDALVRYCTGALKGQVKKIGGYSTGLIRLAIIAGVQQQFTAAGSTGDIIEILTR